MSASNLTQVHASIGYTAADAEVLRKVRRVWQRLEALRLKAEKGGAQEVRAYTEALTKHLVMARQAQPTQDPVQMSQEFWAWYAGECERLGISEREKARGADHQRWCEKWLNQYYKNFDGALTRFTEMPSQVNLNEAKEASGKMLQAYVEAFEKH